MKYKDLSDSEKRKIIARNTAYRDRKAGKIKTPKLCMHCGFKRKLEMHHPDYNKPRLIIWLCKKCHEDVHSERKQQKSLYLPVQIWTKLKNLGASMGMDRNTLIRQILEEKLANA